MEKIISLHTDADLMIFLGDGLREAERVFEDHRAIQSFTVCGNCDWSFRDHVPMATLDLDGVRITCCHGHTYGVKSGIGAYAEYARTVNSAVALFGHTHEQFERNVDGVILFNPGAVCDGCFGIIHIEKGAVLCSHGNI